MTTSNATTNNTDLNWIANYIWGIADDVLRDLYVRGKYRDVILPMTVLRRLDAVLEDSKKKMQQILLLDEPGAVEPVPTAGGGSRTEPELDQLSNILKMFNDLFGDIAWEDADRVGELITKTIPSRVAADAAFKNARQNSDAANSRIEHDKALGRVMTNVLKDDTELFKQFMDNEGFKRWMTDKVFELACEQASAP